MELHLSSSFCLLLSHSINFLREGSEASSVFKKNNQALSLIHDQVASCAVYSTLVGPTTAGLTGIKVFGMEGLSSKHAQIFFLLVIVP